MQYQISTDGLPERDRFGAWIGDLGKTLGLRVHRPSADRPFTGRIACRTSGPLVHVNMDTHGYRVERTSREIGQKQWNGYLLYREASAGAWFEHAGQEIVTSPDDLLVMDGDRPFDTRPRDHHRHDRWIIPRHMIEPHLPPSVQVAGLHLSGRNGIGSLIAGYLDTLARDWDGFSDPVMRQVTDTLARLIGVAGGAAAAEQPGAMRSARLTAAQRYVEAYLADPALCPSKAAAALGISVRTLHALFEPDGTSFARFVQARRLDECKAALLRDDRRPVIEIAFAWGFNSLSSFYRLFNARYDMAPTDLRAARLGTIESPIGPLSAPRSP